MLPHRIWQTHEGALVRFKSDPCRPPLLELVLFEGPETVARYNVDELYLFSGNAAGDLTSAEMVAFQEQAIGAVRAARQQRELPDLTEGFYRTVEAQAGFEKGTRLEPAAGDVEWDLAVSFFGRARS